MLVQKIDKKRCNILYLSCGEVDPMYLSDGCFGITRLLDDIGKNSKLLKGVFAKNEWG